MLLTSIQLEDVEILERIFAVLTPEGWKIPAWVTLLRETIENA